MDMPWFPDFSNAAELVRKQTRAAGLADPVAQYFTALNEGDARPLESVWPGEVVINDPRAGEIRGHRHVQQFVSRNQSWMSEHHVRTEIVASTSVGGRAVVEFLAHLNRDGRDVAWPVAVVAESPDELSIVFRTYCSQWPVNRQRPLRPAILPPGDERPRDVVARYLAASDTGDADAIVNAFAPDGYYREPIGPHQVHRGTAELRAFFTERLASGGISVQYCAVTDDGVSCAVEYNCVQWAGRAMTPQAGLAIYERRPDGLLAAVRVYDDIEPPRVKGGQ
jgi:ketosteroid isomerase-like protein